MKWGGCYFLRFKWAPNGRILNKMGGSRKKLTSFFDVHLQKWKDWMSILSHGKGYHLKCHVDFPWAVEKCVTVDCNFMNIVSLKWLKDN